MYVVVSMASVINWRIGQLRFGQMLLPIFVIILNTLHSKCVIFCRFGNDTNNPSTPLFHKWLKTSPEYHMVYNTIE